MAIPRNNKGQFEKGKVNGTALKERSTEQTSGRRFGRQQAIPVLEDQEIPYIAGQTLYASGGNSLNPMGFPNYGGPMIGSYRTYRWIGSLPPVALVRAIRTDPIVASTSEAVTSRKDSVAPERLALYQEQLNALRPVLMHEFLVRGMDYGWMGGELIWMRHEGLYWIERIKPLLVENTEVLIDKGGNAIGLSNQGLTGDPVRLGMPYKAFKYTYDGEAGNHYGRSWLENIRSTAVKQWLDCMQQLQKIKGKISGTVTIVTAPAGNFPGVNKAGQPTTFTYKAAAKQLIEGLARGAAGAYFPSVTLAADARGGLSMLDYMKAIHGKSLVNVEVVDFSATAQAVAPILEELKHAEELIFNGGLRSARVGLEAKHGTKEEAGTHTDTGTTNSEVIDEDFAIQLQPLMDAFGVANWGESARGAVKVHAPSLVDRKTNMLRGIIMSLLNLPEFAAEFGQSTNVDAVSKTLDIPMKKPFDNSKVKIKDKATTGTLSGKQPEPEGGRPSNAPNKRKKPQRQAA